MLVYKVDRLSRSLLDFARLMESFDKHKVSFVSITQDFNTTSSLGRLTLNVLLSFAQFEREIISERTRDKLSAARRKGKWIGGTPALGYDLDPVGKRLVVNEEEARRVREIFRLYAELGSLEATLEALSERRITTKAWTSRKGKVHVARPFGRTSLQLLLSRVVYVGCVSHKGTVYAGEHERIVDEQVWTRVNETLKGKSAHLRGKKHQKQNALLANLLHCSQCQSAMFASHTTKAGQRHRYYRCGSKRRSEQAQCSQMPVSATDLEGTLAQQLQPMLGLQLSAPVIQQTLARVEYNSNTRQVSATMRDGTAFTYTLAWPSRAGVRRTSGDVSASGVPRVSRLMALAIKLERLIGEGAISNFVDAACLGGISRPRMSQIMRLTDLAPTIQEELLFLPKVLPGSDRYYEAALRDVAQVMDWEEQERLFRSLVDGGMSKGR